MHKREHLCQMGAARVQGSGYFPPPAYIKDGIPVTGKSQPVSKSGQHSHDRLRNRLWSDSQPRSPSHRRFFSLKKGGDWVNFSRLIPVSILRAKMVGRTQRTERSDQEHAHRWVQSRDKSAQ